MLGGFLDPKYRFTYGDEAKNMLASYHADKAILSVDGVTAESGYSTYYPQETEICRQMLNQAHTSLIAADFSKIGRIAFSNIAPVNKADRIVTNSKAPLSETDTLRETGVEIIIV
jgi:DeoR family transcriptional regulator of aga operon